MCPTTGKAMQTQAEVGGWLLELTQVSRRSVTSLTWQSDDA
jgi:hypothetical protein